MKNILTCLILLSILCTKSFAQPDVPRMMSYVGVLADRDGKPLSGQKIITFTFRDSRSGQIGTWTQLDTVVLSGGMFSAVLGKKGNPLPDGMNNTYNIGIRVDGEPNVIVAPLYSAPFALNIADSAVTTTKIRQGSITPDKLQLPPPQGGKNQVLVYNGTERQWQVKPENDSTVRTINGLAGDFKFVDDANFISTRPTSSTDPRMLELQFNGIREVVSGANIELNDKLKSADGKGKKLSAELKNVPLAMIEKGTAKTGDVLQYDESVGGWQPVDPQSMMPVGSLIAFAGDFDKIPKKWLPCDGRAVKKSDFAKLYDVLLSTYGEDAGAGEFRIPDLRGRFLRGLDATVELSGEGKGRVLVQSNNDPDKVQRVADTSGVPTTFTGAYSGNKVGSVQADELKSHSHNFRFQRHDRTSSGYLGIGNGESGAWHSYNTEAPLSVVPTGGIENRPKNIAVIYIIKVQP